MKNRLIFLIASLIMVSTGCTDSGPVDTIVYNMVNNSGHKVVITMDDFNKIFPAELTLQDGESYQWQNPNASGYSNNRFEPFNPLRTYIRVEYDDSSVVIFPNKGENNHRNPTERQNYVKKEIGKHKYRYTYTFTAEDYEYAVNQ